MKKELLLLAVLAIGANSCGDKNDAAKKASSAISLGTTTLRMNFAGDISGQDFSWQLDGINAGANNRAAVSLSRATHVLTVNKGGKKYDFSIDASDNLPLFVEFTAVDGKIKSIFDKKTKAAEQIYVHTEPGGANVFVERHPFGTSPVAVGLVSSDQELEIIATKPGYRMAKGQLVVKKGQINKIDLKLEELKEGESPLASALPRPISKLTIDSPDSPGTKILLNGIDIKRTTPQKDLDLPIGPYLVTLVRADGTSFDFRTELKEGEPTVISENLVDRPIPTGPRPGVLIPRDGDTDGEADGHHHHH